MRLAFYRCIQNANALSRHLQHSVSPLQSFSPSHHLFDQCCVLNFMAKTLANTFCGLLQVLLPLSL